MGAAVIAPDRITRAMPDGVGSTVRICERTRVRAIRDTAAERPGLQIFWALLMAVGGGYTLWDRWHHPEGLTVGYAIVAVVLLGLSAWVVIHVARTESMLLLVRPDGRVQVSLGVKLSKRQQQELNDLLEEQGHKIASWWA